MNGNIYDYLIPVGEAGDKSFTNGRQDVVPTVEQQKKADELVKQIAMKKQLELERGNTEHLLEIMERDTPDAAVYRALLLQQIENTNRLKREQEDKKDGVLKRAAKFVGNAALGTAKFMGNLALRYMAMQALFHAGDIYKHGFKQTWQNWLAENGVGRTPGLAEASGDQVAAINGDLIQRNMDFRDLTPGQKKAVLKYAEDTLGRDVVNTQKADFALKSMYKKGNEYFNSIPADAADPSEYTKEWAMMFNTGSKDTAPIPVGRDELGSNMFDSIFKRGNVRTLITPEDNWLFGNPTLRAMDNSMLHIGDITGRNSLKRGYEEGPGTMEEEELLRPAKKALTEREINDSVKVAKENVNNILANVRNPAWFNEAKFDVDPEKLDKIIDQILGMKRTRASADAVFNALNPNTSSGINQSDLLNFIESTVRTKLSGMDKKEKMSLYKGLRKEFDRKAIGSFMGNPYLKGSYDPGKESNLSTERVTKDTVSLLSMGTGAGSLVAAAALGTASAPLSIPLSITALVAGLLFNQLN